MDLLDSLPILREFSCTVVFVLCCIASAVTHYVTARHYRRKSNLLQENYNAKIQQMHERQQLQSHNLCASFLKTNYAGNVLPSHVHLRDTAGRPMAFLVGAGPGDPELLTVAAVKVLKAVDVVITDVLVPQQILKFCKGRIVYSPKRKGCANQAQLLLQQWIVNYLKKGLSVARLKGGDPFVYGRGMEEVSHVLKAGYLVKVISGVSSSLAAPLAAGISVTARGVANKILLATAHGKCDTHPNVPMYEEAQSTLFLMSISRLSYLVRRLRLNGYPESIPIAIVEKATLPEQRVVKATLRSVEAVANAERVTSPAVIVIGNAVNEPGDATQAIYQSGGVIFQGLTKPVANEGVHWGLSTAKR